MPRDMESPEQVKSLADRKVTVAEMEAAIDAYASCLTSIGWRLEGVSPDPIAGEPQFQYNAVANDPAANFAETQDCESRTIQYVQIYVQVIQEPGPMDPAVLARVVPCLADSDVPTAPKDRSAKKMYLTAGKENVDAVSSCILDAAKAEYPDRTEWIGVSPPPEVFEE